MLSTKETFHNNWQCSEGWAIVEIMWHCWQNHYRHTSWLLLPQIGHCIICGSALGHCPVAGWTWLQSRTIQKANGILLPNSDLPCSNFALLVQTSHKTSMPKNISHSAWEQASYFVWLPHSASDPDPTYRIQVQIGFMFFLIWVHPINSIYILLISLVEMWEGDNYRSTWNTSNKQTM